MTRDEFQRTYHDWQTQNPEVALFEAKAVNRVAEGFTAVAVKVGALGCGLMLLTAAVMAEPMGVRQILTPEFCRDEVKRRLLQLKTRNGRRTCYMWFLLASGWVKADVMQAADDIGMDEMTGELRLEEKVTEAIRRELEKGEEAGGER